MQKDEFKIVKRDESCFIEHDDLENCVTERTQNDKDDLHDITLQFLGRRNRMYNDIQSKIDENKENESDEKENEFDEIENENKNELSEIENKSNDKEKLIIHFLKNQDKYSKECIQKFEDFYEYYEKEIEEERKREMDDTLIISKYNKNQKKTNLQLFMNEKDVSFGNFSVKI